MTVENDGVRKMVKVKEDLTNKRFGMLTVVKQVEDHVSKGGQHHAAWLCQCDCGSKPKVIVGGDLTRKNKNITSCGCINKNLNNKVKTKEDLAGKRFGRWTVLEQIEDYIDSRGQHEAQWMCLCDCGTYRPVVGYALKRGTSKSCGCLANEIKIERNKKYNKYDLSGEFGIGYTSKGEEFWFDLEDYDKIKDYCWHYGTGGYLKTTVNATPKYTIFFHREVMGVSDESWFDVIVDHRVHGNMDEHKYDNRKENLRMVTRTRNNQNIHKRKDNTSGVTGVYWNKRQNSWAASIGVNKKVIHLGYFSNFEDAVKVRKEAEEKYFGEYSFDNSQKSLEEKGA